MTPTELFDEAESYTDPDAIAAAFSHLAARGILPSDPRLSSLLNRVVSLCSLMSGDSIVSCLAATVKLKLKGSGPTVQALKEACRPVAKDLGGRVVANAINALAKLGHKGGDHSDDDILWDLIKRARLISDQFEPQHLGKVVIS